MMKIIIVRDDGGISVMHLIGRPDPATTVAKWQETSKALAVSWHVVSDDVIPTSRRFRNAWKWEDGKIGYDLAKAKMDRAREMLNEEATTKLKQYESRVKDMPDDLESLKGWEPDGD